MSRCFVSCGVFGALLVCTVFSSVLFTPLHAAPARDRRGDAGKRLQLKAYPGHKPVIDPQGKGIGISIFQSSHWDVAGIEIKNARQRGVSLNESKEVTLHDVGIHDCFIYNQTTAFSADGFPGRRAGGGIKYKHASRIPDAFFRVHHNVFRNLSFFAFGSGTANTHFHDNVIAGPAGISSRDFGGVTHQVNQVFENNRIYGAWGFAMNPTMRWRNDKFPDDPKNIVFGNNVVYDTAKAWSKERGIIMIGTYMSDEVYKAVAKELHLAGNSYYNPNTAVQFNIAAGFNYKEGYASGGIYALKEWQNKLGYDNDSIEDDTFELDWRHAVNPVR
ncbi:MAG: hypothetical protein J7M40_18670 [Planctomycetes bacterium]|nr:hypothetical protein [Planctomycetota bacterium]